MRLIDADELKKVIEQLREDYIEDNFFWTKLFNVIDNAPTVETKTTADCIIAYGDGYETARRLSERPQGEWKKKIIELFNKYDVLLVHIDNKIVPVKNSTKQECYNLLYEIQELIEWRKLLFNKHLNEVTDNDKEETT